MEIAHVTCLLVADLRVVCQDQMAVFARCFNRIIPLQLAKPTGKHLVPVPWNVWQTLPKEQQDVSSGA